MTRARDVADVPWAHRARAHRASERALAASPFAFACLAGLVAAACGGSSGDDCRLRLGADRLTLAGTCAKASLALTPSAQLDGTWIAASACAPSAAGLACNVGDGGRIEVAIDGAEARLTFTASRALRVGGLALEGSAVVPGATGWLSNGFQSWSQSGVVAIGDGPTPAARATALGARGDSEVVRSGDELSWWYTLVGGGEASLFAGAMTAERWKPWVAVARGSSGLALRVVSGGAGESVALATGERVTGERWRFEVGKDGTGALERYGRALPSRRSRVEARADLGWNSWYELWDSVDEGDVRENASLAKARLAAMLPSGRRLRVVVDDGWEAGWGDWRPNEKFPAGLDGLARELATEGLDVGVWLAPLLVQAGSELARAHPEWLVEGAEYPHIKNGSMKVLDVTHPDAAAHLASVIARLVSWGYTLLKIDFLFAGAYEGRRHEAVTGMQAYGRALDIIRTAAGDGTLLLAVGAPPVPSFPYVDAWRLGSDIAVEPVGPSWYFVQNEARSLAAHWPLCYATLCDVDPPLQRALPQNEVEVGGWLPALAGGGLYLSDDLRALPGERATWGVDAARTGLALSGKPGRPIDLFPASPPATLATAIGDAVQQQSHHVVPSRWLGPDGVVVYLNFTDAPLAIGATTLPARSAARP